MLLLVRCYGSARVAGKGLLAAPCPPWLAVQPEGPSSATWAPLCLVASVFGQENGSAAFILLLGRALTDGRCCLGAAGALEPAVPGSACPGAALRGALPASFLPSGASPALPSLTLLLLLFLLRSLMLNFAASP